MATVEDIRGDTPKRSAKRNKSDITKLARHHSASQGGDFFTFWKNTWKLKGWITGGYHEIILRDGTVQICYPPTMKTNGIGNHNSYTYHICLVGNGSFTDKQEQAWQERAQYAMERFNLSTDDVLGHNEFSGTATSCPGINMDTVRGALRSGKAVSGTKSSSSSLLEKGDNGSEVEQLQEDLMTVGEKMPRYGADGDYGSETIEAVKAFQSRHDLTADGIAGPNTLDKLEEMKEEAMMQEPNDSHKEAWEWAQEKGLLNGKDPRKPITREQMSTVMKRLYDELKK